MKTNKKGEVTTAEIVTIIILIVSFIVILYFFLRLDLGSTSNAEICHNSVFLSSKSAGIIAGGLQCKTDYVCISGGGKCANMQSTVTINVDPTNKNEIMKAIADQMAQCWWMFGEGKLDYQHVNVGVSTSGLAKSGCAVCSIVEFDSSVQSELQATSSITCGGYSNYQTCYSGLEPHGNGNPNAICGSCSDAPASAKAVGQSAATFPLTYKDVMNYLETNITTQGGSAQTYLYYLYGFYSISNLLSKSQPLLSNFYNSQPIPLNGQYAILTGESNTPFTTLFFSQFPAIFTGVTAPKYYFIPPVFIGVNNVTQYFGSDCGGNFITQAT